MKCKEHPMSVYYFLCGFLTNLTIAQGNIMPEGCVSCYCHINVLQDDLQPTLVKSKLHVHCELIPCLPVAGCWNHTSFVLSATVTVTSNSSKSKPVCCWTGCLHIGFYWSPPLCLIG